MPAADHPVETGREFFDRSRWNDNGEGPGKSSRWQSPPPEWIWTNATASDVELL